MGVTKQASAVMIITALLEERNSRNAKVQN